MVRALQRSVFLLIITAIVMSPIALAQKQYRVTDQTVSVSGNGKIHAMLFFGSNLYVARGSQLIILNFRDGKERGQIDGLPDVDGIAVNLDLGRGFASSFRDSSVTLFDIGTLKTVGEKIKLSKAPVSVVDVINRSYVLAVGEVVTQINARTGEVMDTLSLGTVPGGVADDADGYVFVTLPSMGKVVVIDAGLLKVVREYQVPKCSSPQTISVNRSNDHLYVGCEGGRVAILRFQQDEKLSEIGSVKKICDHIQSSSVDSVDALFVAVCEKGEIGFVQEHSSDRSFDYSPYKITAQQNLSTVAVVPGARVLVAGGTEEATTTTVVGSGGTPNANSQSGILVLARP